MGGTGTGTGGGGGGGGGGGRQNPQSSSPHAASLLGDVGLTTATGTDSRSGATFAAGENIYGPFEAGFGAQQNSILEALGCADGNDGHVAGGLDTWTAEQMVAHQCGITLPRIEGSRYISLLDECGGHTREYHFHERLACLYDGSAAGHSTKVGENTAGQPLYGKWESTNTLPKLDACGGHWGVTPDSDGVEVYHYHVQDAAPFTFGCVGPNDDGSLVTVEQCREFYSGCDDGDSVQVTTADRGTIEYDLWCPCYDAAGSNSGVNIQQLAVFGGGGSPAPAPAPASTPAPTPAPTADPMPGCGGTCNRWRGLRPLVLNSPKLAGGRPNVVLFMPDDMPFLWDESPADPAGGRQWDSLAAAVPHMNRVRREGATFTQAIVAGPKCAPSRFNLMTGRYCSRSEWAKSRTLRQDGAAARTVVQVPQCKIDTASADATRTLPHALSTSGYRTIQAGKWHLQPGGRDFDAWADYSAATAHVEASGFTKAAATYATNMEFDTGSYPFSHNNEWLVAAALAEVDAALDADERFFLYFAPTSPHNSKNKEDALKISVRQTPAGLLDADPVTTMPSRQDVLDRADALLAGTRDTNIGVIGIDDALGAILTKLEAESALANTLVIVTMDHGQIAKDTLYEGGSRVALSMMWTGVIKAGARYSVPVVNLDLAPTILEAAGVAAGYELDGVSLLPQLAETPAGSALAARRCVLSEINADRAVTCFPGNGLDASTGKYMSASGDEPERAGGGSAYPHYTDTQQFYELLADPTERANAWSGQPAAVQEFYARLISCHDTDTHPGGSDSCDVAATVTATIGAL